MHVAMRQIATQFFEYSRCLAQPGRAPALGAGGRGFKSLNADQYFRVAREA